MFNIVSISIFIAKLLIKS